MMRHGLSPRVRGNPAAAISASVVIGSIPACAGEPGRQSGAPRRRMVYPRVCGGTIRCPSDRPSTAGLSPRVRGNRRDQPPPPALAGSIPACAGEPVVTRVFCRYGRVYPRVCGGTVFRALDIFTEWGLSPRVRGNPEPPYSPAPFCGSIPACAGEPRLAVAGIVGLRVYPRVCGGTGGGWQLRRWRWGLSPRVRGNPARTALDPSDLGSIPACAGEPGCYSSPSAPTGVYPRVCGGTTRAPCRTAD